MGGLEAQLPFSVEGINIPEGLHNKAEKTPPCHLKLSIYICLWNLWLNGVWAFEMGKASRAAQALQPMYPPITLSSTKRRNKDGEVIQNYHVWDTVILKVALLNILLDRKSR